MYRFGPTSVCLLMKDALNESLKKQTSSETLSNIRIYVAQDCTIFKQDVIDMCTKPADEQTHPSMQKIYPKIEGAIKIPHSSSSSTFTPCIILISARLGGEELNEIYVDALKMFLQMDMCMGIIGGKPKHSLYFVGYQGDKVIYLDPHFCQPTVNIFSSGDKKLSTSLTHLSTSLSSKHSYDDTCLTSSSISNSSDYDFFDNSSFHCANPSKIAFTKLDPSIAIGFYCRNRDDLDTLCDMVKNKSDQIYPIFGIAEGSFEETQLNYQSFSIDDKYLTSKMNAESKARPVTPEPLHLEKEARQTYSKSSNAAKNSTITSYLSSKINSTRQAQANNSSMHPSEIRKSKSIMSPSKSNKKVSKKSADPDDFVLV